MTTGDLLRQRRADIPVGHVGAPGIIYFDDGSGKHYEPMAFGDGKGAIYGMAVADLNGGERPDIVVARSSAPSVVMFKEVIRLIRNQVIRAEARPPDRRALHGEPGCSKQSTQPMPATLRRPT